MASVSPPRIHHREDRSHRMTAPAEEEDMLASIEEGEEIIKTIVGNGKKKYPEAVISGILRQEHSNYGRVFYYLSLGNKAISRDTFHETYIHNRITRRVYNEEELQYICEGVKLMVERGDFEFFYVAHLYFGANCDFLNSSILRDFLVWMLEHGDYRIREILLTWDIIGRVFSLLPSNMKEKIFLVRFIRTMVERDHTLIIRHANKHRLLARIGRVSGCIGYFAEWITGPGRAMANCVSLDEL